MIKKGIPYLLIAILVGWFSTKFFIERKDKSNSTALKLDWDQLNNQGSQSVKSAPQTIKVIKDSDVVKTKEFDTLTESEKDQFKIYDEIEKKWLESVRNLLTEKEFLQYENLRKANEKEKMQAYQEYHDYLRQKFGDQFQYNISEDHTVRENKINQSYLKELLRMIGEKKFKNYLKNRDLFNEENRRNQKEFLQIEF